MDPGVSRFSCFSFLLQGIFLFFFERGIICCTCLSVNNKLLFRSAAQYRVPLVLNVLKRPHACGKCRST